MKKFFVISILFAFLSCLILTPFATKAADPQYVNYSFKNSDNLSYNQTSVTFRNEKAQLIPNGIQLEWAKTWTDLGLNNAWRIATDFSGNLYTKSHVGADPQRLYVAKLNSSMQKVWEYTDDPGSQYDYYEYGRVYVDSNNNVITGGVLKDINSGQWYWYVIKLDNSGNKIASDIRILPQIVTVPGYQTVQYGSVPYWIQYGANAFGEDASGNIYAMGISGNEVNSLPYNQHLRVIKYDDNLNIIWDKSGEQELTLPIEIGDTNNPQRQISGGGAWDGKVDMQGNIYTTGPGVLLPWAGRGEDYVTTKIDDDGNLQWARAWSNIGNQMDRSESITLDKVGNVYVGGFADGGSLPITVMYNNNGEQIWVKNAFNTNSDLASTSKGSILGVVTDYMGNYFGYGYNNDNSSLIVSYDSHGNRTYFAGGITYPSGRNSGWNIAAANGYLYITTGADDSFNSTDSIIRYKYTFPQYKKFSFTVSDPNTAVSYRNLYSFSEQANGPGQIKYQLSFDGKKWYWWNGKKWALSTTKKFNEANTAAKINNHISTFPRQVSIGKLYVRVFLDYRNYSDLSGLTIGYDNVPRSR